MENKETLKLEFTKEDSYHNLAVSENFNSENEIFYSLADYLGQDHLFQKSHTQTHLTLLEKLEILCKTARELADEEHTFDHYEEKSLLKTDDKVTLESFSENLQFYDEIILLNNTHYAVRLNGNWGVVNTGGELLFKIEYSSINMVTNSFIVAEKDSKFSLFNLKGEVFFDDLDNIRININHFGDEPDYIWMNREGKWGLFQPDLKEIIPFSLEFDECEVIHHPYPEPLIKVQKDGKVGMIHGLLRLEIIKMDKDIQDILYSSKKRYLIQKNIGENQSLNYETLQLIQKSAKNQN